MLDIIADHNRYHIAEVPWQSFKDLYLQHFPKDEDLDKYMKQVVASYPTVLKSILSGYKWVKFTPEKQRKAQQREEVFYRSLDSTCDAIANVLISKRDNETRSFRFVSDPNKTHISSNAGSTHKTGGYFRFNDEEENDYTNTFMDVAVCTEFILNSTQDDTIENRKKIVSDAHYVFNYDPRRMFTFGITIEGEECCVWYFSRSHLAKSTRLHWMGTDIWQFFGVLVAFTFGDPVQLGYDPTISLIRTPIQAFVYKIEDEEDNKTRFFRTTRPISELRPTCISGRATRVWEAVEVQSPDGKEFDEPPKPVVLKDVWLDESAQTERSLQRQIFADIDEFKRRLDNDPDEFKGLKDAKFQQRIVSLLRDGQYKDHFLSIVAEAVTPPSHDISALIDSGDARPSPNLLHLSSPTPARGPFANIFDPYMDQPQKRNHFPRTFLAKKRYRVVVKEVGQALHCIESFKDVAKAMEGAILALFLLFAAGWVHRDISTGNILWYKPSDSDGAPRGILSDFEYARRYPHGTGSADAKMVGTPIFMAGEVVDKRYIFFSKPVKADPSRHPSSVTSSLSDDEQVIDSPLSDDEQDVDSPWSDNEQTVDHPLFDDGQDTLAAPHAETIVKHNFLHDMESGFWVFLYVLCHTRLPNSISGSRSEEFHQEVTRNLFCNALQCSSHRNDVIRLKDSLKSALLVYLDRSLKGTILATSAMSNKLFYLYMHNLAPTGSDEQQLSNYKSEICSIFPFALDMVTHVPKKDIPLLFNPRNRVSPSAVAVQPRNHPRRGLAVASGSHGPQKRKAVDDSYVDHNDKLPISKRSRIKTGRLLLLGDQNDILKISKPWEKRLRNRDKHPVNGSMPL